MTERIENPGGIGSKIVHGWHLSDGAVGTTQIADSAVTAAKIANRARVVYIGASGLRAAGNSTSVTFSSVATVTFPDALAADQVLGTFRVPKDFVSFTSFLVLIQSTATGNIRITATSIGQAYQDGQNVNNRTDTFTAADKALTANTVTAVDMSTIMDGLTLAVDDNVSFLVERDGSHVNDTVNVDVKVVGVVFNYTADS